jgi:hypothetical protein
MPLLSNKHHVIRHVCWHPLPEGFIKVKDGSSFGNPANEGFGGLLKYDGCNWIYGFFGFCGACNLLAEL